MTKKPKVHQCECCKNVITDPYVAKVREFYLSKEHKFLLGAYVPRKTVKKIKLCGSCYNKISNASVMERYNK